MLPFILVIAIALSQSVDMSITYNHTLTEDPVKIGFMINTAQCVLFTNLEENATTTRTIAYYSTMLPEYSGLSSTDKVYYEVNVATGQALGNNFVFTNNNNLTKGDVISFKLVLKCADGTTTIDVTPLDKSLGTMQTETMALTRENTSEEITID